MNTRSTQFTQLANNPVTRIKLLSPHTVTALQDEDFNAFDAGGVNKSTFKSIKRLNRPGKSLADVLISVFSLSAATVGFLLPIVNVVLVKVTRLILRRTVAMNKAIKSNNEHYAIVRTLDKDVTGIVKQFLEKVEANPQKGPLLQRNMQTHIIDEINKVKKNYKLQHIDANKIAAMIAAEQKKYIKKAIIKAQKSGKNADADSFFTLEDMKEINNDIMAKRDEVQHTRDAYWEDPYD